MQCIEKTCFCQCFWQNCYYCKTQRTRRTLSVSRLRCSQTFSLNILITAANHWPRSRHMTASIIMSTIMFLLCLKNVVSRLQEAKTFWDHCRFCSVRQCLLKMFSVCVLLNKSYIYPGILNFNFLPVSWVIGYSIFYLHLPPCHGTPWNSQLVPPIWNPTIFLPLEFPVFLIPPCIFYKCIFLGFKNTLSHGNSS